MTDITGLALSFAVGLAALAAIGTAVQTNVGGIETNAAAAMGNASTQINGVLNPL